MKPVLVVEDKQLDVYSVFYRKGKLTSITIEDESGNTMTYHDSKENTDYYIEKPLQIDFDKHLKWVGRNDDVIDAINKRIEAYEERIIELAQEFIECCVEENIPFPKVEAEKIKREYERIRGRLNGLYEAKEITGGC